MRMITDITEMRELALSWRAQGCSIGFVPTMGYLHRGHLSLMEAARAENDYVVVSIFVNPAQFGPNEDFARYPRDLSADTALAESVHADVLFCPAAADIYPPGFATYVEPLELSGRLCGKSRPGHFRGVCTVVLKLFNIVRPSRAYFGQKDAQQFIILRRMTDDLNLDIEMKSLPIVRERDGLALSSRNVYLTEMERQQAVALSRALNRAGGLFGAGERQTVALRAALAEELGRAPLGRIDYVEIVDTVNLQPLETVDNAALIALAVFFGKTRLIDNIILEG